ncbi:hypothetical protein FJV83_31420 [Mesorhizobium sp. WSM4307]|uniref:hypothetical protein n=1 Tax=unclassified Mesorhizobium TaxID=325217 RepID=UPI00115D3CD4|nr:MULTISPECIES: hypothetical protein [unclassified Mesorhizobium]TRC72036.1 hypothetical protein FJV81_30380 [Mesorhizobium sp. WSM4315]TRC77812.1 hypothetical protein FJV83_31420 [Mesorhizobium sp. WSM4307]
MRENKRRGFPLRNFYPVEEAWENLRKICHAVNARDKVVGITGFEGFPYVFLESTNGFLEFTANATVPDDGVIVSMEQAEDFWFGMVASVICNDKRFVIHGRRGPLVILSRSRMRTSYYMAFDEWTREQSAAA